MPPFLIIDEQGKVLLGVERVKLIKGSFFSPNTISEIRLHTQQMEYTVQVRRKAQAMRNAAI